MAGVKMGLRACGASLLLLMTAAGRLHAAPGDERAVARNEAALQLTTLNADALRTAMLGSLRYTLQLTPRVWLGVDGLLGKTRIDEPNGTEVRSGKKYIGIDGAFYYAIPAVLRAKEGEEEGLRADLFLALGAGHLWIDAENAVFAFLGGGMTIRFPVPWLAVRFDVRNHFFKLSDSRGSDFNQDLVFSVGPGLLF